MTARSKKHLKRLAWIAGTLLILYDCIPLPSPLFKPLYNREVQDAAGRTLRIFLSNEEEWCLQPDNVPVEGKLQQAVIEYEDRAFWRHPGFNPASLLRAAIQNARAGDILSGASTITMQVARLMAPKRRTLINKVLEILQSIKIEIGYTKAEILSAYLNHAPYGGNIRGIRAAALRYFGKGPEELTWSEAATLAVIPNAPGQISPIKNRGRLKQKRDNLLYRLHASGSIDSAALHLAMSEPLPGRVRPLPMVAPHLCRRLIREAVDDTPVIRSTILLGIQTDVEKRLADHARTLQILGIHDAAAIVAETATGRVRAYVGSPKFLDPKFGQVDGAAAPRSSGSLFKPFLWGKCIDEGILLPRTLIKDIPTYYGSFSPANYTGTFDGLVRSGDALIRSLNVPAVRLLYTYGVQPFSVFLKKAGMTTLHRSSDEYGLSLILGGAETTLMEMAAMYRGLALGGRFETLSLTDTQESKSERPVLISPGACWQVLEILKNLKRPGAEYYWEQFQNQWPLAWKTGTSFGHKDGWAVGVSPQWTIAVWTGNFNGEGNSALSGASCAAPLLFDIFHSLEKNPQQVWFKTPHEELREVTLCRETGYLAGPWCEHTEKMLAPAHMHPLQICPYHQRIALSQDGSHSVCSLCWNTGSYRLENRLVFPPEVTQFLRDRGQAFWKVPPHHANCPGRQRSQPITILYPRDKSTLWVPRDFDSRLQRLTCRAAHGDDESIIHWYLDDHYLGNTVSKHTMALPPIRGWHEVAVLDQRGNRDRVRFHIGYENEMLRPEGIVSGDG